MKNKKILILSIITIIIIAAVVIGILYFTTDLFKTEQQLFYKYIAQLNVMDSNLINQYNVANDKMAKNSNSSSANLDFLISTPNQETGIVDTQKILSVQSNGLENTLLKQSYRDFTFSTNDQNFFTLKYIRDDNTYGILAENIVSKYLAVENSNLKDFFAKLGVEDTTNIPDSIQPINYEELLKIDEVTLNQLKETYGTLIYNNINEDNFYKIVNEDKTEIIGVSLTNRDLINIIKVTLETIKNDTTLLNLIVTKAQCLDYNNLNIIDMQSGIQGLIDNIVAEEVTEEQEILKIGLVKKDKTITKLIIDMYQIDSTGENTYNNTNDNVEIINPIEKVNKQSFEFDFSEVNKLIIITKEDDNELGRITTNYSYDSNNINYNMELQLKQEEQTIDIKAQYQINNYHSNNIGQNLIVDISGVDKTIYQINLVNNITLKQDVQISKLTTENSAKLNDMTSEQLSRLFEAIGNRINQLYGEELKNNNDTIISSAQNAREEYEKAQKEEKELLQNYQNYLEDTKINSN